MVTTPASATTRPVLRKAAAALMTVTMLTSPATVLAQTPAPSSAPGTTLPTLVTGTQTVQDDTENLTTGTIPGLRSGADQMDTEPDLAAGENESMAPEAAIDEMPAPATFDNRAPGIRIGTFTLRPSVTETVTSETRKTPAGKTRRTFLANDIRGTLTSDWARHGLTVNGRGTFETGNRNRGDGPTLNFDADLRLDLAEQTTANITAGYNFEREDDSDPNAITGASSQSGIHRLNAGVALQRSLGIIRGTAAVGVARTTYSNARLADGTSFDEEDRNRTATDIRLRAGYELSAALIPFVEVAAGVTRYDNSLDRNGYDRSSNFQALRTGVELDLGEKLRGELALGYRWVNFDDDRLLTPKGLTVDGAMQWSPQRGTDVSLGLRTTLEEATTPGLGGWTQYEVLGGIDHRLRENLLARLSASGRWREYPSASGLENFVTWNTGAGLVWNINRYLDLDTTISWERTPYDGTSEFRIGTGLTLRR